MDRKTYKTSDLIHTNVLEIGDGYRAKNSELAEEGLPFARAGTINNGFNFLNADRFPHDRLEDVGGKVSLPGDVVFTSKGTVGRIAFVRCTTPRFVYSPQLCYWRSLNHDAIWPRFLYYWMKSYEFSSQVNGVKGQSDMADYVSLTEQRRMYITLPSITVQRQIGTILGLFDDKIDLLQRQNKTLENIAQTIFKEWFVNFMVNGKKLKIDNATGLPEGWRMGTLSEIIEIHGGGTPKTDVAEYWNGDIPWFSVQDVPSENNVFVIGCEKHISREGLENSSTKILPVNSTIITARGTVGKLAVTGVPMAMNQSCYGITPKDGKSFFFLYLTMKESLALLKSQVHGAVFDTITRDTLNGLPSVVPDEGVVGTFEMTAKPFFAKILLNNSQIQTLSKLRNLFLPKMMKGEIRVRDTQRITEERL